jgi:hypothetical protein
MAEINRGYFNTFHAFTKGLTEKTLFSFGIAQNTGSELPRD